MVGLATAPISKRRVVTMVESRFGSIKKWKSRLTSGAMKTQTYALIRIEEVLEVTATIPMTTAVSCNRVIRSLRVTTIFPSLNRVQGFARKFARSYDVSPSCPPGGARANAAGDQKSGPDRSFDAAVQRVGLPPHVTCSPHHRRHRHRPCRAYFPANTERRALVPAQ